MPLWWDKFLKAAFGGTYETGAPTAFGLSSPNREQDVALDTFRHRISVHRSGIGFRQVAPGWDYMRWKPYGKHRMRHNPDEFTQQCDLLAPYVQDVTYSAWLGLEERRWAGLAGGAPPPVGLYQKGGSRSLGGSRDTLG